MIKSQIFHYSCIINKNKQQRMQVQQENINKGQDQNNPFLVVSTEEIRNIAQNLTQPVHLNEDNFIESLNQKIQDKQNELQSLKQQNTKLKSSNKQLVKQLQTFSKKLDQELKRRAQSQQRRPKITLKPQEKQSIEIQNLYKKIEIYKKSVAMLKAKLYEETDGGQRINEYENKLKLYIKENEQLKDEIKSLKKIIKLQEKGLSDIGAQGFLKITAENDKLKQQLRKVRLQMDQIQRKYRTSHVQISKPKHKTPQHINNDSSQQYFSRSGVRNDFTSHKQIIMNRKKNFSDYRMRTQPEITLHKQSKTQDNESQVNVIKPYIEKIQKLQSKIRAMNSQKVRQREIIENLKIQILQKDKEVNYLREKTQNLRKMNRAKKIKETIESKENQSSGDHSYLQAIDEMPSRSQSKLKTQQQQDQTIPMEDHINKPTKTNQQRQQHHEPTGKSKHRYPRLQEIGSKKQSSYKWNHHQFSSKIKEIQVYLNTNGSVGYIHARYQKGEPNKSSSQINGKKSLALVCEATSEYVENIKGGFRNSHLQYIIVKTNQKRLAEFGNTTMEKQCENFQFNIAEYEYPCALLGENDLEGVLRFGCFVERQQG